MAVISWTQTCKSPQLHLNRPPDEKAENKCVPFPPPVDFSLFILFFVLMVCATSLALFKSILVIDLLTQTFWVLLIVVLTLLSSGLHHRYNSKKSTTYVQNGTVFHPVRQRQLVWLHQRGHGLCEFDMCSLTWPFCLTAFLNFAGHTIPIISL